MNYFKQIWYEMRHQKMMTWVSISGTALSIFLVMAFFMTEHAKTVAMSPESDRDRIFIGENIHTKQIDGSNDSSGPVSYEYAKKLYEGLDGVELIAYMGYPSMSDVNVKGEEMVSALRNWVDDQFWKIYDFRFVDGRPFEKAEYEAVANKVILTRSLARRLFGEEKVAGREIVIDCMPYDVVGVVEDVNPLFQTSYANLYTIFDHGMAPNEYYSWFGSAKTVLLAKEGVSQKDLQRQVESRYASLKSELEKDGFELIYHNQPYGTAEVMLGGYGSNNSPDIDGHNKMNYLIYTILILLPAINLSSMTRSRLRHRVTEIGVRRAFGAKRSSIIGQMFGENLIITVAGGAIGLVLSIIFVWLASSLFFNMTGQLDPSSLDIVNAQPTLGMLFTWKNFLIALGFCFILNILSASVPAWKASRVEPAVAIAKSR